MDTIDDTSTDDTSTDDTPIDDTTIDDTPIDDTAADDTATLRKRAARRIRNRREFHRHLVIYLLVNALVIAVWAMTSPGGFFWPVFLIAAWGIGLVMHGWDAYVDPEISDAEIDREIARRNGR